LVPTTRQIALQLKIHVFVAAPASTRPHRLYPRHAFLVMLVIYALEAPELLFLLTLPMDTFVLPDTFAHKAQIFDRRLKRSHVQVVLSTPSRELLLSLTVFLVL